MAVREFNGTSDQLTCAVGAVAGMTYGAVAMLVKFSKSGDYQALGYFHNSSGSWVADPLGIANFNNPDSSGGGNTNFVYNITDPTHDGWLLLVLRKGAGSSAPRLSVYNFTHAVWTHLPSANGAIGEWPAPGAGGTIQHSYQGGSSSFFGGRIAARAYWANSLPWAEDSSGDAAVAAAGLETAAANWLSTNPSAFWLYNQPSTSVSVDDLSASGTADQTSIVGTTVVTGDDPPSFSFSLTGPSGEVDLTGSGTFAAAGAPALAGALNLSGSGSLAAAGAPGLRDQIALAGAGALSDAGVPRLAAQVPLDGSGDLALAGSVSFAAGLVLGGAGTLILTPPSTGGPAHEPMLTATNAPSSQLVATNAPSSRLEAHHGV